MTYDFDSDQWLEMQEVTLHKRKLSDGEITEQEFKRALVELEQRHLEM